MQSQQLRTQAKRTQFFSKGDLASRYGVTIRTLDRWLGNGIFPGPDLVLPNGLSRWSDETVVAHERASVGRKGVA